MTEHPASSLEAPASGENIQHALHCWLAYLDRKDPQEIAAKMVTLRYYSAPELVDLNRLANTLAGEFSVIGVVDLKKPVPFEEARSQSARLNSHDPYAKLVTEAKKQGIIPEHLLIHISLDKSLNGFDSLDLFVFSENGQLFAFTVQHQRRVTRLPPKSVRSGPARNLKRGLDESISFQKENVEPSTTQQIAIMANVFLRAITRLDEKQKRDQEAES